MESGTIRKGTSPMNHFRNALPALWIAILPGVQRGTAAATGPCDIYQAGGTPCVTAHSTVRALYGAYAGSLYQVRRASDNTTKDIGVLSPGGAADAAVQDQFCANTTCTISIIYDQSPKGNHLTSAPASIRWPPADKEAVATALKLVLNGHEVYGIYIDAGMGYRNDKTSGVATGDQPEAIYMVTSGKHFNNACCFDYGNAETNNAAGADGTMEAVYFGNWTSQGGKGSGKGPWVMADLENGLYVRESKAENAADTSYTNDYVTGMVKGNSGNSWALKGGNAQAGGLLTIYSGVRPTGYNPMKKEGAVLLGIGGDNSHSDVGSFFEGCMTSGFPSDATDAAVQANIVAAGYGRTTTTEISSKGIGDPVASVRYDPATTEVAFEYTLESAQSVRVRVFDLRGREVAQLLDSPLSAGAHEAVWDAKSARPGLYAVAMEVEGRVAWSGKVIVGR